MALGSRCVADDANAHEGQAIEVACLCDGCAFHVHGQRVGIGLLEALLFAVAGDETVTGEDEAGHNAHIGLQGGGLATVGVDYYALGKIAGEMGADILEGKSKPADMPIRHQTNFKVKINEKVMEELGIRIDPELLQTAERVRY